MEIGFGISAEGGGWSQEELARKGGLGRSFTGALERGEKDLGTNTLYKLAKVFEVKLAELLEGVDDAAWRSSDEMT